MSLKNAPVPMPEKRVTYKKGPNGTIYVYLTVRAYRNKNGKPTSDEVAIGKKDTITGQLIPNRRYYELFQSAKPAKLHVPVPQRVQSSGNIASLMEIANQTGLSDILQKCFPDKWDKMIACAFYMISEGNVMMYIDDWFDETNVKFTDRMNDVECSKLFSSITEEERNNFFKNWIRVKGEQEYIAYDITSISTYSRKIDIAEWGYNRDNDALPQVNLGMYYGVTSHMPIYYNLYNGSIPDKSYLEFMMTDANSLGILDACFVLDRAFVTESNFNYMYENGFDFITAMPGNRLEAQRLIDKSKHNIRKSANRISEYGLYGLSHQVQMYGNKLQAHIYYDPEKQAFDEKELYAHIERLRVDLENMNKAKRVSKKYKDYYTIDNSVQDKFIFELDTAKVDEKLERSGYFILLSSKPELNSSEVLKIYRERDVIEKNFEQFKNRLDFKRIRAHWRKTMEGKVFIGFLALIIRAYMRRKIKDDPQTKHLTFEKIMIELRKIKSVTLSDMREVLIPLTKQQKTILSVLSVTPEALTA